MISLVESYRKPRRHTRICKSSVRKILIGLQHQLDDLSARIAFELNLLAARGDQRLNVMFIQRKVAVAFEIHPEHMTMGGRFSEGIAKARMAAMALTRDVTDLSLSEIATAFNKKDHGTVLHAVKRTADECSINPKFAATIDALRAELKWLA